MKTGCPKCDAPLSDPEAGCPACGHQWHLRCGTCGKPNIPRAVYCGGCGLAIRWQDRIWQRWERSLLPLTRQRIRGFASGMAFGGLVTVFAFGSMGMTSPTWRTMTPAWEMTRPGVKAPATEPGRQLQADLESYLDSQSDPSRPLSQRDLVRVGNLLLERFGRVVDPDDIRPGPNFNGAMRYLQSLQRGGEDPGASPVKRGDVAVFFYRLMKDLFEIPIVENATLQYSDIPRFHFMNLPVETLEALGLHLARGNKVFGGEDVVSLSWLSQRSIEVVRSCEARLKQQKFPPLEPRN